MSTKNLSNKAAIDKLKKLANSINFAMMATYLQSEPFHTIPMSTKKVDEEGNIWFLSGRDSEHNKYIQKEGKAQLIYSQPNNMEFMTVYGNATIHTDKKIIKELYSKADDNWFDGVDDPNASAIKIQPTDAHYWDTQNGKLVALFKLGVGAVTGDQPDLGEEGDLIV